MADSLPLLEKLVRALKRLPGIGEKAATRLALFILRSPTSLTEELIQALTFIKDKVRFCEQCQNLSAEPLCSICQEPQRDTGVICVIQEPVDLLLLEKTGEYHGLYHVLHGALSPLEGVGPDDIHIQSLLRRVREGRVREVILATNPNPEGEATALYLKEALSPLGLTTTRIASGIPLGSTLEYTDAKTLARALGQRRDF